MELESSTNLSGVQAPMSQPEGGAVERSALSSLGSAAPASASMDPDDWRAQLPPFSREKIVDKIVETLKKHPFFSGEGLKEIKRIAVRFEENIYSTGKSPSDYLRRISMKMLTMETNSESPLANSLQTNGANVSTNSSVLGKGRIQSESAISFIDGNNLRGSQVTMGQPEGGDVEQSTLSSPGGAQPMDPNNRRVQLPLDSCHRIGNIIMETSGQEQEVLHEIKKIVAVFEQKISKIYSTAISQSDDLREISSKMLITDTKSQSPAVNLKVPQLTHVANATKNSSDLGKKRMRSESAIAFINGNNWRGAQVTMGQLQGGAVKQSASSGNAPPMDPDVWRAQLPPDCRPRIVNKIVETLKKHIPFSGEEGIPELKNIAERFEENVYSTATSQSDYLRRISLKMLSVETRPQSPIASSDLGINI